MSQIEFALGQGPVCFARTLRSSRPGLKVDVESFVLFQEGHAYETIRLKGEDTPVAVQEARRRFKEDLVVLEAQGGHARIRFPVEGCPLMPLLVHGGVRPEFPFKVEADGDRWVVEDDRDVLEGVFKALSEAGLLPRMVRRDPERRP